MDTKLSTKPTPPKTYVVGQGDNSAIIQLAALPNTAVIDTGRITKVANPDGGESVDIMYWGDKNDVPMVREQLIIGNNIVPALIERKQAIILGQRWYAYTEKYIDVSDGPSKRVVDEVPMPEDAKMFFKKFKKEAPVLVGEFLKHACAIPEFIRNKKGEVIEVSAKELKYCRMGKKDSSGKVVKWFWSNFWDQSNKNTVKSGDKILAEMPIYTGEDKRQSKFIMPIMDMLFNDNYYPIPAWWGGRQWVELANIIPIFHKNNLTHGQTPRWHIIIPHDYFYDYQQMDMAATEEERAALLADFQAREQAFVKDLDTVLTGIGNTGRTITSKSEIVEAMGSKYEKVIKIEPLKPDLKDEALLKLYEASNVANISGQAIHPTLANIETAGKMSSGTEIRNAFLMYLIIAAPKVRDMLYQVVELVKEINGWPADIHFAIQDAEMTTLAENPAGVRPAQTQIG